jgi:superfamily I DNA/RNA helicase
MAKRNALSPIIDKDLSLLQNNLFAPLQDLNNIVEIENQKAKIYNWTQEGCEIRDLVLGGNNVTVKALAGTGKTSLLVELFPLLLESDRYKDLTGTVITYCVYSNAMAKELRERITDSRISVLTIHSLLMRELGEQTGLKIFPTANKSTHLLREHGIGAFVATQRVWEIFRSRGCTDLSGLTRLREEYPSLLKEERWDVFENKIEGLIEDNYKQCLEGVTDYADFLWFPKMLAKEGKLQYKTEAVLCVDELQDTAMAALDALHEMLPYSQVIGVGDDNQTIFSDLSGSQGIENFEFLEERWGCQRRSLTKTWRCPDSTLELARARVPEIHGLDKPGVEVQIVNPEWFASYGDMVLGAKYSDILPHYLRHVMSGLKCVLKGRDVLAKMLKELDKIESSGVNFSSACEHLALECESKANDLPFLLECEDRRKELQDRADCFVAFSNRFSSAQEAKNTLVSANKKQPHIVFTSIHRAKGLEAQNTWICGFRSLNHKAQSDIKYARLEYVACTRHKKNINIVLPDLDPLDPGIEMDTQSYRQWLWANIDQPAVIQRLEGLIAGSSDAPPDRYSATIQKCLNYLSGKRAT